MVSFEDVLNSKAKGREFGTLRYVACYKDRAHISKSKVDASSNSQYIKPKQQELLAYDNWKSKRYIVANAVSYDVLVSVYDINVPKLAVLRIFRQDFVEKLVEDAIKGVCSKKPNLEARIVGLQNGQEPILVKRILQALKKHGVALVEVDLFGNEIRHIAIDAKNGMSYNVLLEDRNYRPGELVNPMTIIDFERSLKGKAAPVVVAKSSAQPIVASPLPNPIEKNPL